MHGHDGYISFHPYDRFGPLDGRDPIQQNGAVAAPLVRLLQNGSVPENESVVENASVVENGLGVLVPYVDPPVENVSVAENGSVVEYGSVVGYNGIGFEQQLQEREDDGERERRLEQQLIDAEKDEEAYEDLLMFRKEAIMIIEEFFATDDADAVANELRELNWPFYHYYFVKKLITTAMDRQDKEKEMAACLISSLYAVVFDSNAIYKGFAELVRNVDDLAMDVPDIVDVVSLFIARAVIDEVLPPIFLSKIADTLDEDSIAAQVIKRVNKVHLNAVLSVDNLLHRWSGSRSMTVEAVRSRIQELLVEYAIGGDMKEAFRCIRNMKIPFYHHEIVKRALILAMERPNSAASILDLLEKAFEQLVINASQMTKGFNRLISVVDDLSLDILNAKNLLQKFINHASSQGWLNASALRSLYAPQERVLDHDEERGFKLRVANVVEEYLLMGDVSEVTTSLDFYHREFRAPHACNVIFVKELLLMAMGRNDREKEMTSYLLTKLGMSSDDIMDAFLLLLETAEDTVLDHPYIISVLSVFMARAAVDEVIFPAQLDDSELLDTNTMGKDIMRLSLKLFRAPFSAQRVLRCWGGCGCGCGALEIENVKERITGLLQEYDFSGDFQEACRCIRQIGLPFFHHEVVKKAVVYMMGNNNTRMWNLLEQSFLTGVITETQIAKGFKRVQESMDDLILDIPQANKLFDKYLRRAIMERMIDPCFYHAQGDVEESSACLNLSSRQ